MIDIYHQKRIIHFCKNLNIQKLVDVGAHKGEFLSYFLKIKNLKEIYAFEPQVKVFQTLNKKYGSHEKIKLFQLALDNEIKSRFIYINKISSTSTLSTFNKKSFYLKFKNFLSGSRKNYIDKYKVKTNTIDNFFENINLENTLLKIDVEGFEMNVLQGSINKLDEISYILIEKQFGNHYENTDKEKINSFLIKNKFKIMKKFTSPTFHIQDILYKKTKMI